MSDGIEQVIAGRARDIGGFEVRRVLPSGRHRAVGPFVFFDEMGPAAFAPGAGLDVRPHPHIGLATVTYLFEGEIVHRDSLGVQQSIVPGDVNWMVAGSGIVHSERTGATARAAGGRLHGIQSWIALPRAHEEIAPSFRHHAAASLPLIEHDGVRMRLIAGEAFGARSPVDALSPIVYLDVHMPAGSRLPLPEQYAQRAVYPVSGCVRIGASTLEHGAISVLATVADCALEASEASRVMVLGGAALDGERHLWWNFVSSSPERIERAKTHWREGRFARVPGDPEFIPLPES
jgi:redox-sensitive bicupin YhaK (pirin superfamily)